MTRLICILWWAVMCLPVCAVAAEAPPALTVYAAASLTDVLQPLGASYTRDTGIAVKFSFAASSALARQIESGAEADLFVSADQEWMDYLAARHLIRPISRYNLLGNRLALVAPADSRLALAIGPRFPLLAALGGERLATGDPDTVPVGRYARAALTTLGVWGEIEPRLVRAENVRSALAFVARGEVPLGIVYATDARVDPKVRIVGLFPESAHPPITYPVALTRDARPGADRFLAFLRGPAGRAAFEKAGFMVLP
jgi:molybdate transport system substrate-binding protein